MVIKNNVDPLHQEKIILAELCKFIDVKLEQPYVLDSSSYLKYFESIYPQLFKVNESAKNQNIPVRHFKKLAANNNPITKNSTFVKLPKHLSPIELSLLKKITSAKLKKNLSPIGISLLKQHASTFFDLKTEFDNEVKRHKANLTFIKKNQNSPNIDINDKVKSKMEENSVIIKRAKKSYKATLDLLFELNTALMYILPKSLHPPLINKSNGHVEKDTFERNIVKDVYKIFVIDYLKKLRADIYVGDYLRKDELLELEHKNAFIENKTVRILINNHVINHCYERLIDLDFRKQALEQSLPILKNIGRIYPNNNTVFDFIVQNCAPPAIDTSIYVVTTTPPTSELDIQPFVETLEKKIDNYQTRIKHCNNKIKRLKDEISTFENQSFFTELGNPTIKINLDNLCEWLQGEKHNKLRQGTKPQKP